ncbi:ROK family protein [Streptomyces melanosporofaciens]|nr:ROK family protein [Streptomyces melanosporofaciens]
MSITDSALVSAALLRIRCPRIGPPRAAPGAGSGDLRGGDQPRGTRAAQWPGPVDRGPAGGASRRHGILQEVESRRSVRGRPPRVLTISPQAGTVVAVDVDTTASPVAIADLSRRLIAQDTVSVRIDAAPSTSGNASAGPGRGGQRRESDGPGRGRTGRGGNSPALHQDRERYRGGPRHRRRRYRGADGAAGDIGHTRAVSGGKVLCVCGSVGCVGAIASHCAVLRGLGIPESTDDDPLHGTRVLAQRVAEAWAGPRGARRGRRRPSVRPPGPGKSGTPPPRRTGRRG